MNYLHRCLFILSILVSVAGNVIGQKEIEDNQFNTSNTIFSFHLEDKWTYEARNHPLSLVKYQEYTIVDSIEWHGKNAWVIEPGLMDGKDYMYAENGKIYFWDEDMQDFQLNYDFNNDSIYYIRFLSLSSGNVDSIPVFVDSVVTKSINNAEHEIQYCRSTLAQGNIERPLEIIKGIGINYGGLRLPVFYIFDDLTNDKGRIRCYENETLQYNFTVVSCDSTWHILKTDDVAESSLVLYPNPVSDYIKITTFGDIKADSYSISDLNGNLLINKKTIDHSKIDVSKLNSGVFFLILINDSKYVKISKFIKY